MEKAVFIKIARSKKGNMYGQIKFENGKTMPVSGKDFILNESLQGQACKVERVDGKIVGIVVDGKKLSAKPVASSSRGSYPRQKQKGSKNKSFAPSPKGEEQTGTAKAPYNFIPLNQAVIKGQELPSFDTYNNNRFTGHIACELETLTPLYIRDTYSPEELNKKEGGEEDNPDFFSPGKQVRIPGSSLRGAIRNLVEIIGWGKFGFYDNKLLFYRGVADKYEGFRKEYQKNMFSDDRPKNSPFTFNAGYLQKEGSKYYIIPAKMEGGRQFTQEKKQYGNKEFVVKKEETGKYLVISGNMPRLDDESKSQDGKKKKRDWLVNPPNILDKRILVPDQDIQNYLMDENRYKDENEDIDDDKKHDGDLMRMLKSAPDGIVPCFYVSWKDSVGKKRISFGHTGYFRLAYNYTIGDYLPASHGDDNLIDFAESIFGSAKKEFASRVFFEDATLAPDQQNVLYEESKTPQILAGPKPTTFQHYLEPNNGKPSHWNSKRYAPETRLRGNKLYWHRKNPGWEMGRQEMETVNKKITTRIRPVKEGTQFKFKIRFENLTSEELGLMLFALDLPEGLCHKIGMGKPLGLGSVKITPLLFISDRQERYGRLFDGDKWHFGDKTSSMEPFKKDYEQYLLHRLKKEEGINHTSLWGIDRLRQLKTMLRWGNVKTSNWLDKTKYMEIKPVNEFKKRMILPKPVQVTGQQND